MYLVDSNVLIEAKNRYYAFDIAPGFWEWLERAHRAGRVFSIEKVEEELLRGDDELAKWAQGHHSFFRQLDQRTTQYFSRLSEWARSQNFRPAALHEFTAEAADYLLVAFAAAHSCTLVTNEVPDPNSRKRVKIPDACRVLNVDWTSPFDMLRSIGVTLRLGGR